MFQSKIYNEVVAEIDTSLGNMVQTGIFRDDYMWDHEQQKWINYYIPTPTMRRIARQLAREMKRPFILAGKCYTRKYDNRGDTPWNDLPIIFSHAYLRVPRVKYLSPVINPLMLASAGEYRWARQSTGAVSHYFETKTVQFSFNDEALFDTYLARLVDDEDMRKAILYRGKDQ